MFGDITMALDYMDDDELVYRAKTAAKDIVNAKYEVTQKVGDFLFLAHSEEEFYQRAQAVDQIIDSASTRRLASVSDSKAKLTKALYQEWELKHASCDECAQANFNLPEKVAFPIWPKERTTRRFGPNRTGKLWKKWPILQRNSNGEVGPRQFIFENKEQMPPAKALTIKNLIADDIISKSQGRMDDPEVKKKAKPGDVVWVDPQGRYGRDKVRKNPDDGTEPLAMLGRLHGISSLGNEGLLTTYHKCTGKTSRGFNGSQSDSFPQCTHVHHEGDGCGLTAESGATEDRTQPGCGQHHFVMSAITPQILVEKNSQPSGMESGGGASQPLKFTPAPYLDKEIPTDSSSVSAAERQRLLNESSSPELAEANFFDNPSDEQAGDVPPSRMFLLHPEHGQRFAKILDKYDAQTGGSGSHPSNLDTFKAGNSTYRVGDIVSLTGENGTKEKDLGIIAGTSSHKNDQHVRFARENGLAPATDGDPSAMSSTPGDVSLIIHRMNTPKSGRGRPSGFDPSSGIRKANETTQYYPPSMVNVVKRFEPQKTKTISALYDTLKRAQKAFSTKPKSSRPVGRPKTIKPSSEPLTLENLDLPDIFGDSE